MQLTKASVNEIAASKGYEVSEQSRRWVKDAECGNLKGGYWLGGGYFVQLAKNATEGYLFSNLKEVKQFLEQV